jgi:hypothetical protein
LCSCPFGNPPCLQLLIKGYVSSDACALGCSRILYLKASLEAALGVGMEFSRITGVATAKTDSGKAKEKGGSRPRNYSWAQLMAQVFEFDVLAGPRCGERMRMLASITSPDAIREILACLRLPTRAPPIAPASRSSRR